MSKDTADPNHTINQLDLIDIYRILYSTTAEYSCFSSSRGTFTKIEHILACKTCPNKFERIEIIQRILSDHNGITLEINNRKIVGKDTDM